MNKILAALKEELRKSKDDDLLRRNIRNAIYFVTKAIEQQKLIVKKSDRKLKQAEKEKDAAMKEALKEIEKKRHAVK